jgi:nucleoside-diphosphate-sugar epimerase
MKVLVTGAAGFLGTRLVRALLAGPPALPAISRIVAADVAACPVEDSRVDARVGTIANPDFLRALLDGGVDIVYHLAAVLSGQAEGEFDLGMQVNVDATRSLLEACRHLDAPPRVVFSSTIAVFGGPLPDVIAEDMAPRPQTSYGAEKVIGEVLVAEYSRRGFIDGIIGRLPTVAVRPGRPNSAMSSFVSGIIREPLAGIDCVCPVPLDTRVWISSPDIVTTNLVHAAGLSSASLDVRRAVNFPGLSVTPAEMLDSLERFGGSEARARVRCELDPGVMRVVGTWPGAFDASRSLSLGFQVDHDIDAIVRQFMVAQGYVVRPPGH